MITWSEITALRLKRQHLLYPVTKENYNQLFANMSPVSTMYWTTPGDPPTLPRHADFDDYDYNSSRRSKRELLKGRFGGGSIAYVTEEDLEVFACLYRKEPSEFSSIQMELMELLKQEGPMNIGLMKELTGLLVKEITPALHKLQEAFLVYEDQLDNEGDRGWYLFDGEFPEVDLERFSKVQALKGVLPRAAKLLVFCDEEMLRSYYRLPLKLIKEAVRELVNEEILLPVEVEGKNGYLLKEEKELLSAETISLIEPNVILLQRNDFLVKGYADYLKIAYPSDWDALYYLLIDGVFHGVVVGRFKFGPHVIEDIILDLEEKEKTRRREEILKAVYEVFDNEGSSAKRYCGIATK
ncbi:MAG: hypothetical protein K0S01_3154 [Herbinix sp.]|jgi:hypothetical protein|nr:hypothetical protein [Herbinix sp.]